MTAITTQAAVVVGITTMTTRVIAVAAVVETEMMLDTRVTDITIKMRTEEAIATQTAGEIMGLAAMIENEEQQVQQW